MGGIPSRARLRGGSRTQETAEYLIGEFIGGKSFPLASDYWKKLLELPIDLQWPSNRVIDACRLFSTNNCRTRHLAKILIHLAWCLQACVSTSDVASSVFFKALNALSLSSVFLKYIIENSKSDDFRELYLSLLEGEPLPNNMSRDQNIVNLVMHSVLNFIAKVDVSGTYLVLYELLNFMLITTSTQLLSGPSPGPSDVHPFLDSIMTQESSLVNAVVRKLLFMYITRPRLPYNSSYDIFSGGNQRGVLRRVGSAAANLMLLPFNFLGSPNDEVPRSPLAEGSLNILLILTNYHKRPSLDNVEGEHSGADTLRKQEPHFFENPFRKALESVRDTEFDRTDIEGNAHSAPSVRLPFASLYDALSMCVADEASVLLLYSLVHGNSDFLEYVLVRTDLDTLLMPMLETLYNAPRRSSNHIYMVLVIFLILSQDSSFNASIHKLILPDVSWYQERLIHQTSLGSLIVIILISIVKYNLFKLKDIYLHTNCLATLANMAPHAHRLSAYASQRLVILFEMLLRKYNKLAEMRNDKMQMEDRDRPDSLQDDSLVELNIYTDLFRVVLEIINAILTYALPHNPEVVYAIMHRQELFLPFRNHPRFSELFDNIYAVLDFFNRRMDDAQNSNGELSVEKVLQIIVDTCRSWRGEGIEMYSQLRFTYEEESNPEEFFIPYVWQLVLSRSDFTFNPSSIHLFPVPLEAIEVEDESDQEFEKLENGGAKEHALEGESLV